MINPSGVELIVNSATEVMLRQSGKWESFHKREFRINGKGPDYSICIYLGANGLGDAIHTMPAIEAKINEGFLVSIYAAAFQLPIFRKLGCLVHPEEEYESLGLDTLRGIFGVIYNAKMWCMEHDADCSAEPIRLYRFAQFAQIIETTLPKEFSFRKYLVR
jgi:hypothetical protein